MPANVSMFSSQDAADLLLQRPSRGRSRIALALWAAGFPFAVRLEARLRKKPIIEAALEESRRDYEALRAYLGERPIARMVDIGCGQGLIDLHFYKQYACSLHLMDVETSNRHDHEYRSRGSGFASLKSASKFLLRNGVPSGKIRVTNPNHTRPADAEVDLIISLRSCGFYYPVKTYTDYVLASLRPGGLFIFDMRKGTEQDDMLGGFARIEVIEDASSYRRIAAHAAA